MATGIDTNLLVRWLVTLPGEEEQSRQVRAAVEALSGEVHVCLPVLVEAVWVLRSRYRLDRAQIGAVIEALLASPAVRIAERDSVAAALDSYRSGGPWFADHLIGALNRAAGCTTTLTLDKQVGALEAFTALT